MAVPHRLAAAAEWRAARIVRQARASRARAVFEDPVRLRSDSGLQLEAHVHHLGAPGRHPAVVLCPGIDDPGAIFDTWRVPLKADEVARLGAVVLHFDPAGRGNSWGDEDYGGPEHQENVAAAVRYLTGRFDVDPERIGVVSISLGVAMAVGAVANQDLPVRWLIDWEGPCDREIITAGGTMMVPAAGHDLDDDSYWAPREAVRHVAKLRCGYVRLQGHPDHAQDDELRHATRMLHAASEGDLPWFQINDHPRGEVPPRPLWLRGGYLPANRVLLRKIRTLMDSEL